MTDVTSDEILHLAKLARLTLSEDEVKSLGEKLPEIVAFVEKLNSAKISGDLRRPDPVAMSQLRTDQVRSDSLSLAQLEKLAPSFDNNQVVVPAVFGEADDA